MQATETDITQANTRLQPRADTMLGPEGYNYDHFRRMDLWGDVVGTLQQRGIAPGDPAADFALERADGGQLRLSDLRGRIVLLHFGSFT